MTPLNTCRKLIELGEKSPIIVDYMRPTDGKTKCGLLLNNHIILEVGDNDDPVSDAFCTFAYEAYRLGPQIARALLMALDELDHHCYCSASQPVDKKCYVCQQIEKIDALFGGGDE